MRVLLILSIASSVSAWSFTWTNSDGKSYVENDNSPVSCQTIDHAEGETFRWVPGDDGFSLWLWENDNCSGSKAGYSPPSPWTKAASRDLRSFRVADEDAEDEPETTTTTTTTITTTKPTTTTSKPTTVTVTQSAESPESTEEAESTQSEEEAEPTTTEPSRSTESADSSTESTQSTEPTGSAGPDESDESDESEELTETSSTSAATPTSNTDSTPTPASSTNETPSTEETESDKSPTPVAAIAGGTIGAIAAIAAIGALFFFLGRRRRAARDDPQPPPYGGTFGPGDKSDTTTTATPLHPTPMYGAAAYSSVSTEGKMELDSAPVYQVMDSEPPRTPVKQVYSPLDSGAAVPHYPSATVVAELPGDAMMVEMSDAHRLNELDGSGRLKKW